ncbi:hypothetical protein AB0L75_16570 [Streptomyces sp. NPDC052101]|uniref:hypothetical protein n=1 Tax=Streptomyces sp. NPDC052101 TaxID=3155763 RepID=UPI003420DF10
MRDRLGLWGTNCGSMPMMLPRPSCPVGATTRSGPSHRAGLGRDPAHRAVIREGPRRLVTTRVAV